MVKLSRYDTADFLKTNEDIQYYLAAIAEDNDPALIAHALGAVARARGMSQLSRETGISRMGLIKALSGGGNPSFATITKVLDALGYRIDIVPKANPSPINDAASDDVATNQRPLEPLSADLRSS
ncbi:MAG: putative addiction module antidote protein [Alphaproteobacteria bacterium]|jgi:probable addiction module antidote protein|nr:putative addiction module antidote protein [Beijerinckiaceae bacterium]NBQ38508.1 putative addiction module antidote protein [Alphaproteobacteria bacterium]